MNRRQAIQQLGAFLGGAAMRQKPFDAAELSTYRLEEGTYRRFAHATRLIAKTLRADQQFERDPLVTREISVGGDAAEMATALQRRIDQHPALSAAMFAADISARDYARFAIALFAAHLAHGFVSSGAMRRVPPGTAADNVAFVAAHAKEIQALLQDLKVD